MNHVNQSLPVQGQKRFLNTLEGHKSDRIPLWFMRQAGRYLPEYRELRTKKGSFLDMAYDPDAACEVTMQPIRRYQMDAAIIFSDILVIPHALGQHLEFVAGEGPKLDPIHDGSGLKNLGYSKFSQTLNPVYQALKNTRAALSSEGFHDTALIGFAGAPWTVATYMVEGGGSKDFAHVKKFAYSDPDNFQALIDLLVEATSAYLIEQVNAGAEALQIFDSWSGALDSDGFKRWVIRPAQQIVKTVKDTHPHIPIIGFPKGAGQSYLAYVSETGVDAVGLDTAVNTKWAASALQNQMPVQGNLDPIALLAGGDAMKRAAERILSDLSAGPFIFNLGHGINKDTPPEHVAELVEFVRGFQR
ncbi:MAG: uroporphyrinogen decarboxylase [Alphaproteobacteria bacterium]|nr:uroporphyrinogen decarboxylase [Alphaproteobacteria bacterium]